MSNTLANLQSATGAYVDEPHGLIWIVQADGTIGSVAIAGGGLTIGGPFAARTRLSPCRRRAARPRSSPSRTRRRADPLRMSDPRRR